MKQDFRKYAAFQNAPKSYEPSIMPEKVEKTVNSDDAVLTAIYAIEPTRLAPAIDKAAPVATPCFLIGIYLNRIISI